MTFNLSAWAITHRPLVHYFMAMLVVIGVASYMKLGRNEDPTFTIKAMTVRTQWPGATLNDTLLQISKGIRGANGGIALIAGVQRQHGESLETIIRLVTPEPGSASDGPSLEELIGALLVRLDNAADKHYDLARNYGTAGRTWFAGIRYGIR